MASHAPPKQRTQIMLDEDLYQRLMTNAQTEGRSVSSLVREAVTRWLAQQSPRPIEQTSFWSLIGAGASSQGGELPISENVDHYLYKAPTADADDDEI